MINREKKLLLTIKFIPLIVSIAFAIIGAIIALYLNKLNFENKVSNLKSEYYIEQKKKLEYEVQKIHKQILNEKKLTEDRLKQNIKEKVYSAYAVINNVYKQNKNKSNKEIIKLINDALRDVRFNDNRGYFFFYKMDGTVLLLPPRPDLEGKNLIGLKDAKGNYSIKNLRDLSKKHDESFYTWWWYKPGNNKHQSKKIGFAKYFEPLDCFVGTGEYVEDFEKDMQKHILQSLSTYSYDMNKYIFIIQYDGKVLTHKNKDIVNTNQYYYRGTADNYIVQSLIDTAKNNKSYLRYNYKSKEKIAFVTALDDWKWVIGTSFYIDDVNALIFDARNELIKQNKSDMKTIFIVSTVIIAVVTLLSIILSNIIKRRFEKYKERAAQKDKILFQKSKMAAMGEMLENIAHQWRQPLSMITTSASGLKIQHEMDMLNEDTLGKALDDITNSAEHLSQTVDDFRDFYKDDKEAIEFNIKGSIDKSISLLSSKFKNRNIELNIDVDDIKVKSFKNELVQVFMNILNNSKDALDDKEIDRKMVFVDTLVIGNELKILFLDNAGGIDKKDINKIFEYKYTTKENSDGTGIGLYMSKLIIEKLNGNIEAYNETFTKDDIEYTGAKFIITLPI